MQLRDAVVGYGNLRARRGGMREHQHRIVVVTANWKKGGGIACFPVRMSGDGRVNGSLGEDERHHDVRPVEPKKGVAKPGSR
jgi:hypothetical protein